MTVRTIDIEDAVASALLAAGFDAGAPPVPKDLSAGRVQVTRTGGERHAMVIDDHRVDLDCWAESDAAAMELADLLTDAVYALEGTDLLGVPCYSSAVTTLPYGNPDPRHPTLCRATLKARVTTRVSHT